MNALNLIGFPDFVSRIEGAISTFLNADWRGARRKRGAFGILTEFVSCVVSHNAPTIYVSRLTGISGIGIERLLSQYGVKVWDRGVQDNDYFFAVKRRQVKWAEYVLLRNSVPVTSVLKEGRNTQWAAKHDGIPIPRGWGEKKK